MKKIILISLAVLAIIFWNNIFLKDQIAGLYISNSPIHKVDGPPPFDTLILFEDGSYKSKWSSGFWDIYYGDLRLFYNYEFGKAGYGMPLYRPYFLGRTRIRIDTDFNYYYRKVN